MFRRKSTPPPIEFDYLISLEENSLDIVLLNPIYLQGARIDEFHFEYSYFFDWLKRNGMNIRINNTYDTISDTMTHSVIYVGYEEYPDVGNFQVKQQILKFLNDYQKNTL
jgi:hypothetical protein